MPHQKKIGTTQQNNEPRETEHTGQSNSKTFAVRNAQIQCAECECKMKNV